jgi:hypothetical protein
MKPGRNIDLPHYRDEDLSHFPVVDNCIKGLDIVLTRGAVLPNNTILLIYKMHLLYYLFSLIPLLPQSLIYCPPRCKSVNLRLTPSQTSLKEMSCSFTIV